MRTCSSEGDGDIWWPSGLPDRRCRAARPSDSRGPRAGTGKGPEAGKSGPVRSKPKAKRTTLIDSVIHRGECNSLLGLAAAEIHWVPTSVCGPGDKCGRFLALWDALLINQIFVFHDFKYKSKEMKN